MIRGYTFPTQRKSGWKKSKAPPGNILRSKAEPWNEDKRRGLGMENYYEFGRFTRRRFVHETFGSRGRRVGCRRGRFGQGWFAAAGRPAGLGRGMALRAGCAGCCSIWPTGLSKACRWKTRWGTIGGRLPDHLRGLITAGIRSGHLAEALEQFVDLERTQHELRRLVWLNLAYPTFLMIVMSFLAILACLLYRTSVCTHIARFQNRSSGNNQIGARGGQTFCIHTNNRNDNVSWLSH